MSISVEASHTALQSTTHGRRDLVAARVGPARRQCVRDRQAVTRLSGGVDPAGPARFGRARTHLESCGSNCVESQFAFVGVVPLVFLTSCASIFIFMCFSQVAIFVTVLCYWFAISTSINKSRNDTYECLLKPVIHSHSYRFRLILLLIQSRTTTLKSIASGRSCRATMPCTFALCRRWPRTSSARSRATCRARSASTLCR
jgi:hypothetical protein